MDKLILAIETSCDETSAAVVKNGKRVLSNIINSQIDIHSRYGGVVPEIASRRHIETIDIVVDEALTTAGCSFDDIDAIAVTYGPGLVGALLVGVSYAKALSFALKKPLIPVHHIKGHIMANFIANENLEPPFICLIVSGGHSHIVLVQDYLDFKILGRTKDDAAGEAFDKIARVLGLSYPGGPKLENLAKEGNPDAIAFPRVKIADNEFDFSFSGVKTSVINYIHKLEQKNETLNKADIAASFQAAITDVLCINTVNAAKKHDIKTIAIAGGVAANNALRKKMEQYVKDNALNFYYPPISLCTDNAAMIGCAGYYELLNSNTASLTLNAVPSLPLSND